MFGNVSRNYFVQRVLENMLLLKTNVNKSRAKQKENPNRIDARKKTNFKQDGYTRR